MGKLFNMDGTMNQYEVDKFVKELEESERLTVLREENEEKREKVEFIKNKLTEINGKLQLISELNSGQIYGKMMYESTELSPLDISMRITSDELRMEQMRLERLLEKLENNED